MFFRHLLKSLVSSGSLLLFTCSLRGYILVENHLFPLEFWICHHGMLHLPFSVIIFFYVCSYISIHGIDLWCFTFSLLNLIRLVRVLYILEVLKEPLHFICFSWFILFVPSFTLAFLCTETILTSSLNIWLMGLWSSTALVGGFLAVL